MTYLQEVNMRSQFSFCFTFERIENVLPAEKKKRKNSRSHVWRSFPKMADWPALFAERKRPTDGSTHGREISLAPVVTRYPAVRFVHGI